MSHGDSSIMSNQLKDFNDFDESARNASHKEDKNGKTKKLPIKKETSLTAQKDQMQKSFSPSFQKKK